MERQPTPELPESPPISYEQVALEALVDALFIEGDRKAFAILTEYLNWTHSS